MRQSHFVTFFIGLAFACSSPARVDTATDSGPTSTNDAGSGVDAGAPGMDAGPGDGGGETDGGQGDSGSDGGLADSGVVIEDDGGQIDADDAGSADGSVDAGPRHTSYVPASEHPTTAARLIVMGDSTSAGYGASASALAYESLLLGNDDTRWPGESGTSLSALFSNASLPVVNVATAGATSSSMLNQRSSLTTQLGSAVSGHSVVVITIGEGDLKNLIFNMDQTQHNTALNNVIANLRQIIGYLQDSTRFPDGTSIYLAAPPEPTDTAGDYPSSCFGIAVSNNVLVASYTSLRTRYIALGMELNFAVVDALGHFHGHGVHAAQLSDPFYDAANPVSWVSDDCIHPNDLGHNELRRLFFEAITQGTYVATDL